MNTMQRSAIATALLLSVMNPAVAEQPFVIKGGAPDGQYSKVICPAIAKAMKNKGFSVVCLDSAGAGKNFSLVSQGKVAAGLVQRDVLSKLMNDPEHPEFEWLLPIGDLAPEALWFVVKNPEHGGRLATFSQLLKDYSTHPPKRPFVIGVAGTADSGSHITLTQVLPALLPELKANMDAGHVVVKPMRNISPATAYNYLGQQLDAMMYVMMPNPENLRLRLVRSSEGKYRFLEMSDARLSSARLSHQSLYDPANIPLTQLTETVSTRLDCTFAVLLGKPLSSDCREQSVTTYVTQATLLVNPETADPQFINALSEVVNSGDLMPENSIAGQASRWWQQLKKAATTLAGQ